MRVVVHIGVHKTGTTALQQFLMESEDRLRANGVYYRCPTPEERNHHRIARAFRVDAAAPEDGRSQVRLLMREAEEAGCGAVLLSSEIFAEGGTDFARLRNALRGAAVEVIAYIRRPDEIVESAYGEVVRSGRRTRPLESGLPYDPTYLRNFLPWIKAKIGRLVIAPFDPDQWKERNLFADFLATMGISSDGFDLREHGGIANRRLPAGLTEVVRVMNRVEMNERDRSTVISELHELASVRRDLFPSGHLLSAAARKRLCYRLEAQLSLYEPHFRPGFDPSFLTADAVGSDDAAEGGGRSARTLEDEHILGE